MKKRAPFILLVVALYLQSPVFALESMSETKMKNARGQAGVEVEIDNVEFVEATWELYYTDEDGISGSSDDEAGIRIDASVGSKTVRAIYDETDRDGYLQREYGTLMNRGDNALAEAHSAWLTEDPENNTEGLEKWMELFPDEADAVLAASGGNIEATPLIIDVSRKLSLCSGIAAFNQRSEGLETARQAYEQIVPLGIDFGDDIEKNITTIMNQTGMTEDEARATYYAATRYAALNTSPNDRQLADEVGTEIALQSVFYDGVVAKLPTIEVRKNGDTKALGIVSEGSVNDGKSFIMFSTSDATMTVLGGTVEVTAN